MHPSHNLIAVTAIAALLSLDPGLGSSRIRGEEPRNPPAGTIDQAGPRKLALLVGISQYERAKNPPRQPPDWWNLHCQSDVDWLKKALLERFSFPEGNIRVLTDAAATRQGIMDAFRDHLIAKASPGALVYFHYSGHGQQIADDNGDELDGLDESLVTADYKSQSAQDGAATNLRDDTIGELLRQLRTRMVDPADDRFKGNITVTFDCCFSGTATRGEPPSGRLTHRGRGWNEAIDGPRPPVPARGKPEDSTGILDAGEALTQGYVAITATRSDQTAKEKKDESMKPMGAFTFYLHRALDRADKNTTYRDVFHQVNAELTGDVPDQSPTIEGEADKLLFSGVAVPPDPYVVVQDNDAREGTVTLPIGRLHGATVGSRFAIYRAGSDVKRLENRIAEAQITMMQTTSSLAQLQGEQTKWPKQAELKAARAVETEHNFGDVVLKVFLDGITGPIAEAIRQRKVLTTAEVTKDNYDVRVGMNREGNKLVLEHKDGRIIRELEPRKPEAAKAKIVSEALFGAWKWLFVSRLRNDDPQRMIQVEFRLVPVEVELNPVTKKVRKIIRERTDVKPEGKNRLVLQEGDCVVPWVRDVSELRPAHITILDLASNGTIAPIYPKPWTEDDTKFERGEGWRSLGINYVFRATSPKGASSDIDVFKAIGTREKADFSSLLYHPADRQGIDKLKEDVRRMREGRHHALARLIGLAKLGEDPDPPASQPPLRVRKRSVEVVTAEVTDWSTAEFVLEVRKRTP